MDNTSFGSMLATRMERLPSSIAVLHVRQHAGLRQHIAINMAWATGHRDPTPQVHRFSFASIIAEQSQEQSGKTSPSQEHEPISSPRKAHRRPRSIVSMRSWNSVEEDINSHTATASTKKYGNKIGTAYSSLLEEALQEDYCMLFIPFLARQRAPGRYPLASGTSSEATSV
jgi:hypothetical protein